jgi:Lon protease-like protein
MIIPLFPLQSVLFPGGRLPLRIFEQRYMDMAKVCLKEGTPFGICLIASGDEVAQPGKGAAHPHATGTLAYIADWDMPQLGVLNVTAQGSSRFRVLKHWAEPSQLLRADVEAIPDAAVIPIPGAYARLVPLLRAMVEEMTRNGLGPAEPHRFFDAGWLGMRYAEVLPIPAIAKQKLLEVEDSIDRLEIIYRFLESKELLPNI